MTRTQVRAQRAVRRRQAAAVNVVALGLAFVLVPMLLGRSPLGAALRPLMSVGWLLLLGGGVVLYLLRRKAETAGTARVERAPPRFREVRRPSRPAPPVERIKPVGVPARPPAASVAEPAASASSTPPRPRLWDAGVFSVIEWRRFEAVVEALFAQAGFLTRAQSHGPDDGVDVWLYSKSQPDGAPVSVVQCKHWQGRRVGVDKVRELRGVMAARNVARGQFATTGTFTADAIAFGEANGIKLHDLDGLLRLIATRSAAQQEALLAVALEGEFWRPTCVNCGVKMLDRTPRNGGKAFWGCVNYPRCRTTMQKRVASR